MSENEFNNEENLDMDEDLIVFETEDGEEVTFVIEDYFFYNGDEYAILTEYDTEKEGRRPDPGGAGRAGRAAEGIHRGLPEQPAGAAGQRRRPEPGRDAAQAAQKALKHYSPGERSLSRAAGLAIIATRARRGARRPEGPEKWPEDRRTPNRKETDHERNEPGAQPERRRDGNG